MASPTQNKHLFTIFLKYNKFVKKVCVAMSAISELYEIAQEKFEAEIRSSLIVLYLEDKEFGIHCELEQLQQLYHGAIVEVRKSKSMDSNQSGSSCNSNQSSSKDSNPVLGRYFSNLSSRNPSSSRTSSSKGNKKYSSSSPTWSSIISRSSSPTTPNTACRQASSSISTVTTVTPESEHQTRAAAAPPLRQPKNSKFKFAIPSARYYFCLLRGIPFSSTHEDIVSFFAPLQIYNAGSNGILFATNYQGYRIGHAFVVFASKTTYESALKLDHHYISGRSIQISACNRNDLKKCVKISQGINMRDFVESGSKRNHFLVKLKGFSFDIDESGVCEWLRRKSIVPAHVHVMYDHRNRNSGIAYLEFKSKAAANRVFELNNEYLGTRYINVFISTLSELRMHLAQVTGCALPHNLNPYLNCLRMDGVPNATKTEDIFTFFDDSLGIIPKQLYIKHALNIVYIEFNTQFDCQLALTRNQSYIACGSVSSLVRLMQVSKYELRSCVDDPDDQNVSNKENELHREHTHKMRGKNTKKRKQQKHIVSIRGIPFDSDKQAVLDFFKGYDSSMNAKSLRLIKDEKGRFSGQATVVFRNRQQAEQVVATLDRKYIGKRYVLLRLF
eukprot:225219_1